MQIHLTTDDVENRHHGVWFVENIIRNESDCPVKTHRISDCPTTADAIVVIVRSDAHSTGLRKSQLLRRHFEKTFVYDCSDLPVPLFPGLYASLPQSRMNPRKHAAAPYLAGINTSIDEYEDRLQDRSRQFLFSFMGAVNCSTRRRLFRVGRAWSDRSDIHLQVVNGWTARSADANVRQSVQSAYAENLLQSRFVLCPRGIGTSSFRLYETMQLGRVPVILSDAWAPPKGPAWDSFSIRIAERDIAQLPGILRARQDEAFEMGAKARVAWEEWFAPRMMFHQIAESIAGLGPENAWSVGVRRHFLLSQVCISKTTRCICGAPRSAAKLATRAVKPGMLAGGR